MYTSIYCGILGISIALNMPAYNYDNIKKNIFPVKFLISAVMKILNLHIPINNLIIYHKTCDNKYSENVFQNTQYWHVLVTLGGKRYLQINKY